MFDMIITDKDEIINEYVVTDITLEELSEIYGVELEELHQAIQDFDEKHKISIESRKVICKLYDRSNFSVKDIAFIVNCNSLTVTNIAIKYGLKRRSERMAEEHQKKIAEAVDYYIKNPNVPVKDIATKFNISSKFYLQIPNNLRRSNTNRFYYSSGETKPINSILCNISNFNKIDIMSYDINVYTKALFYLVLFSRSVRLYNCTIEDIEDIVYIIKLKQYDPNRDKNHSPEICVCTKKEDAEEIYNSIMEIIDAVNYIQISMTEHKYNNRFYELSEELLSFKNEV